MVSVNSQGPLDWKVPIANKDGTPTPEFMRKWAQQRTVNGLIPDLSTAAKVSAVIDLLGSTVGSVLIRGASQWAGYAPVADGRVFRDKGVGAVPIWDTLSNILDVLSATRGSLLYRGNAGWAARVPVTANNVLKDGGVGADPSWDTLSNIMDVIFSNARGSVLYRGASGWAALAPGTAGNVLTTHAAGADPTWAAGGGGSSSIWHPGYAAGRYNTAGRFWVGPTASITTNACTTGKLYCSLMFAPAATLAKSLGCYSQGTQTATGRLGMYTNTNGAPDQLIVDAGTIASGAAAGQRTITGLSFTVPAGWSWFAFTTSATWTLQTHAAGNNLLQYLMGNSGPNSIGGITGYSGPLTFGALPGTFPTPLADENNGPYMHIQY